MSAFEGKGVLVRRRAALLATSLAGFAAFFLFVRLDRASWLTAVAMLVSSAAFLPYVMGWWPSRRAGRIVADAQGLSLDGRRVLARRQIDAATQLAQRPGHVRIWRRWRMAVEVELGSEADASALLEALGLGAGQSIASFWASDGTWKRNLLAAMSVLAVMVVSIFAVGRLLGHVPDALVILACVLPVALTALAFQARVLVGSDGVLIRRALVPSRFVPYASITFAECRGTEIVLHLRSGASVVVSVTGNTRERFEAREALVAKIEQARAAHATRTAAGGAEALLAPGGRPVARWLRDVRALASAREYRDTTLDAERLFHVVTDAAAPAAARAGAALALAPTLEAEGRARLRVASDACADPRLRVALLRVAEKATEEEIDEAVAAVAAEQGSTT